MMIDHKQVRSNILRQGTKILYALIEQYQINGMEDTTQNHITMNLIASIAEGKVLGTVDDDGKVKWALSPDYQKEIDILREQLMSENVLRGPW